MVKFDKLDVFFDRPLLVHDRRVYPVEPALAALVGQATWQVCRYKRPIVAVSFLDNSGEGLVLLGGPLSIFHIRS